MSDVITYGPGEMLRGLRRVRGPVSTGWLGLQRYDYLLSPAATEFVLAHDELFRWREAFEVLVPVDGETALIVSDGADHTRRRSLVRPALAPRRIADYLPVMTEVATQAWAGTAPGEPFDAYALMRGALRRSTIASLFGDRIAGHADALGDALQPLIELTDAIPQVSALQQRLNTPGWRRAMQARDRVDAMIYPEIRRAREEEPETPVLARLVHEEAADGSRLSDQEVRDQVVSLIAAGYETTSAGLGWALYALGCDQELQQAVRDELLAETGGGAPDAEQLRSLPLLSAVVSETLRLYSPVVLLPRWVAQEFRYEGHRVPRGSTVVLSPYVLHRSEALYADPLAFSPQRWLDGARPAPHEYLPFGGGTHRCIGSHLATTEMVVMLAVIVGAGRFRWVPGRMRAQGISAMRPRDGVALVRE